MGCSKKEGGAYLRGGGLIEDLRYIRNLCTKVSPAREQQ